MNNIFCFNENKLDKDDKLNKIEQMLIDDKCCIMCKNSKEEPHYEMGYYAGSDSYCTILNKLILEYGYGQQCLFFELRKE